ncbi:MAG: formate dehydrogenase accessory protein FdhE [Rhodocyclales bacterium]|nr:formate dehydrogenase accessory protein FdhE [Rhodocyclales bacterium]
MTPSTIQIKVAEREPAAILRPERAKVFHDRAARFFALADGHPMADWLRFLGHLTAAQDRALKALPAIPPPAQTRLRQAREYGMPPLNPGAIQRPPVWRAVLRQLVEEAGQQAPAEAQPLLKVLSTATDADLESLADALLHENVAVADAGRLTFAAAALQVVWTAMATALEDDDLRRLDPAGLCPCCGSLPTGSLVRLDATVNNLRYLHCSLCNTEWNVPRAVCTSCASEQGVAYQTLTGEGVRTPAAVRAETCDHCHSYLKIHWQEHDPGVDPIADDLATLALDLLVDEAGYERSGPNLLLLGGAG